jgi:hypothetical protein
MKITCINYFYFIFIISYKIVETLAININYKSKISNIN